MRDLLMFATFLGVIPMIFIRPHIGVLLWGWVAMFGPNFILYGFAASIRYNFIFAILTIVSWTISKEKLKVPLTPTAVLIVIFCIWGTLSAITSISSSDAVMIEWVKFVKIMIFPLVILGLITTRQRIHAMLLVFTIALGYYGTSEGLKFLLSGGNHRVWGPGASIIGDNNHFALAMVMLLPLVFYLIKYLENRIVRVILIGSFILISFSAIGTYSRGGLIGLSAIGIWSFFRTKNKIPILFVSIILASIVLYMAPEAWFNRMDTIQTADQDRSFMGRVISWKLSILVALDHPIFGGGFHSLQDLLVWLEYSLDFDKLSFIPTRLPDINRAHAAHSIYFQVLGDMGFVGLMIFLAILFLAWKNTTYIIRHSKERMDLQWIHDLGKMIQISLIAYMVSGAALSMAYFDLSFAIIALTAVLRTNVDREAPAAE